MTGCSEFLDFLRAEIVAACRELDDPDGIALRVEREVRLNFGAERVYVAAPENDRMQEGLRMLRSGVAPDAVADRLNVHRSTAHRWRARVRKTVKRDGIGREDWVL